MACTLRGVALAVTRLHRGVRSVMQPIDWVLRRRAWWDHPPAWARWAQPGDRKFTRRLLLACTVIGLGGGALPPLSVGTIGPCWLGMLIAIALFPTRRRVMILFIIVPSLLWPYFPQLLFESDWVPWSSTGS